MSTPLPTQYFANAVGSVDFVPGQYVYLHWSGAPLSGPEFRALYVHARNLLVRHHLHSILVDHRAMPDPPAAADRDWLLHEWLPETVRQARLSHYAVLPMPDPARRLHTEEVVVEMRQHLQVDFFDDVEPAAGWLHAPSH